MQVDGFGSSQGQSGAMDLFLEKQTKRTRPEEEQITLGKSTHTKKEWENLLKNVDDYLDMVKEEQKLYAEKLKKDAETRKIYQKLEWKAKDQRERLLKERVEKNITKQLLTRREYYRSTPEELAEGEYEISDKDTGQTYKFQSNM